MQPSAHRRPASLWGPCYPPPLPQHVNYLDFIQFLESAVEDDDMAPELEEGQTQRDDFFNLPMSTPHAYAPAVASYAVAAAALGVRLRATTLTCVCVCACRGWL